MIPTNENIVAVIDALGETIKKQQSDIYFKDFQIAELQEKLKKAQNEIALLSGALK